MALPGFHNSQERDKSYEEVFRRLDLNDNGKIDFKTLKKAFENTDHPLKNNEEAMQFLFAAMDGNHDGIVDLEDFKKYASIAEGQIEKGFQRIDVDNDGMIRASDVSKYLSTLAKKEAASNDTKKVNSPVATKFNKFIEWACLLYTSRCV